MKDRITLVMTTVILTLLPPLAIVAAEWIVANIGVTWHYGK